MCARSRDLELGELAAAADERARVGGQRERAAPIAEGGSLLFEVECELGQLVAALVAQSS